MVETPLPIPPPEKQDPSGGSPKLFWLLCVFVPLLVGFLIGPGRLVAVQQGHSSEHSLLIGFSVFTLICCVLGNIGIAGGFKKRAWKPWCTGLALGLGLWLVEQAIIFFIGCTEMLRNI